MSDAIGKTKQLWLELAHIQYFNNKRNIKSDNIDMASDIISSHCDITNIDHPVVNIISLFSCNRLEIETQLMICS